MDETKSLSETEGLQPPVAGSGHSPDGDAKKDRALSILRRLGKGGFGEVFLAHDDDLDRPVAIKVPRRERVSQPEDIEAYLNEARIVAGLDHPHIVPVYDVGRTDDGLWFIVSKFVEGSDLAVRMGRLARPYGSRRNWWPRSPKPCITPIPKGWSTGTSSPPTS